MDYVCLLYDGNYYDSGASGVFFDAVNSARPIIARPTRFVTEAFTRFGNLGFLCDSKAEVSSTIARIINGDGDSV